MSWDEWNEEQRMSPQQYAEHVAGKLRAMGYEVTPPKDTPEPVRGAGGTKVYVVTSGEYSDFGIVRLFSAREKAEAFLEAARLPEGERGSYDYRNEYAIHEYELDGDPEVKVRAFWCVRICLATGETEHRSWPHLDESAGRECEVNDNWRHGWLAVESPVSIEHAAKVAAEQRQKWLRERAALSREV